MGLDGIATLISIALVNHVRGTRGKSTTGTYMFCSCGNNFLMEEALQPIYIAHSNRTKEAGQSAANSCGTFAEYVAAQENTILQDKDK